MLTRALVRAHIFAYRLTRGRLGGSWGKAPILLLTTTGRRSRKPRTTPLLYLEDDGRFVVVATNDGAPEHPWWYRNLERYPTADVQIGDSKFRVKPRTATDDERESLWPRLVEIYPNYERDQRRTDRELPVVIFER
jgi:deazaflavin-dependent oxidoreductase (nitroreductase family)